MLEISISFNEKKETNVFFRGVTVERPVGLIRNQESQVGQEMHRFQSNRRSGHCQAPTKAKALELTLRPMRPIIDI